MSTVIGDLFVRLGVDLTEMNRGFSSAESRLEKFGTQMFFLGSRITAGVGIPFAAATGAVTKWGMEFDKAMTESLAIMDHVTPTIRTQMEGVAKSVTNFSKFSAAEGAEGFYHLASAGLDATTAMGALPIATRFAQAGVMELGKATEFLAAAQAAMGHDTDTAAEKVDQMARVADVLTLANNRALGTIQDFAEALTNKAGAALRLYHKDVEEGVAVLAAYATQGLMGRAAGQALMMTMRDLGTQALKHADAFAKFNISVYDSTGNMKNMADIIGDVERATRNMSDAETQAMLLQLGIPQRSVNTTKALIGYSNAIREHEAALRQAGGTTQKVADEQMKALSNQVLQLYNQFKVASIEIFQSFVPVFTQYVIPLAKSGLEMFKSFGETIAGLPMPVKALAVAAGALLIAIGPIVATIGSFSLLAAAALRGVVALTAGFGGWATAAGLAAGGTNWLTVSTAQLNAAQLASYVAAVNAANAQGIFGAAAVSAGLAAGNATAATQALNIAQAQSAASVGLFGRALALLTNPITVTVGGILAGVTAVRYFSGAVDDNGNKLSFWQTGVSTIGGAFKFLGDVLGIVVKGWSELMSLLNMAGGDAIDEANKALGRLNKTAGEDSVVAFKDGYRAVEGASLNAEQRIQQTSHKWDEFVLNVQNGSNDLMAEIARLNAAMNKQFMQEKGVPKIFRGTTIEDLMPKVPYGALAKDPYKAFADMAAKARKDAGDVGNGIPVVPPEHKKQLSDLDKMLNELSGANMQKQINDTAAAFRSLVASGKAMDPAVHERMWEAYKKLRVETTALVPEFESLFKEEIKQHEAAAQAIAIAHGFGHTWEEAAEQAIHGMKGLNTAQATVFYDSSKAMDTMREMSEKSTAKLIDVETELHRFSESAGEAHRSTLKSNLAKIQRDQEEHYRDALKGLARVDGEKYDEYVRYLGQIKAQDAEYLRVYEAVESGKYAASIGVNKRLLRDWEQFSQAQRDQIIHTREEWLRFLQTMGDAVGIIGELGTAFSGLGMEEFGSALSFAAQNMDAFLKAGEEIQSGNMAKGILQAVNATINGIKAMKDMGSKAGRTAVGAEMGFMLGGVLGGAIGAAVGFFMKDPGWKKLQDTVKDMWGVSVTKELAKQIDADSGKLGGKVNAMLMHISEIIDASGGITSENVNTWAGRIAGVFDSMSKGSLTAAQAAKVLDSEFDNMVKAGSTSNGIISDQVRHLIELDRQYQTNSESIKKFVDAQLSMAASGFNKVVAGMFGPLVDGQEKIDALNQEQSNILEKIMKLKAQIADYEKEGTKNEKQRVALILARVHLAKQERLLRESEAKEASISSQVAQFMDETEHVSADAQDKFDRMGRLALVTFNAMISSGKSYRDALAAIGDGLDVLIEAQKEFGLTGTDAFNQLMHLRDFATVHPELMDMLDGLSQMMIGLSNTSFMTEQTFNDLGDTAADVFQKMVDGGLTADEAMAIMQPTLQLLWELQKKFGFEVDEATKKLLEQAEASGAVGEKYMSANDKMVLGIDKLNKMFELFLKHLGVDVPAEAEAAAKGVEDAFSGVNPQVDVDINYREHGKPPEGEDNPDRAMAEGGVLTRPTHVLAGEAGPEAFIPLDRLFEEISAARAGGSDDQLLPVTIQIEGESVFKAMVKVGRKRGWIR